MSDAGRSGCSNILYLLPKDVSPKFLFYFYPLTSQIGLLMILAQFALPSLSVR